MGRITQIIGPVLDVVFSPGKMPNIYNALIVQGRDTLGQSIYRLNHETALHLCGLCQL